MSPAVWYFARSAGIVAYLLLSGSVVVGLLMCCTSSYTCFSVMDSRCNECWYTLQFRTPHLASMKTEEKFIFLVYELFLGLSRGEETFVFGKCDGSTHDHPWIELTLKVFL